MPLYQITSILKAAAPQSEVNQLLLRLSQIVITNGGVVAGLNNWGLQELAYRMRAHQEYHTHGRFVQFKLVASPGTLRELERNMKLERTVLRHMTIKERNTSIASFNNLDAAGLAEAAHRIAKQLQETTPSDGAALPH